MPHSRIHDDLALHGPDGRIRLDPAEAMAWCHELTNGHQENFSVLSRLVPSDVRDDFAAFYAFCRTADDLGDEIDDPVKSLELLAWFREQIELACRDEATHPALVAMSAVIRRHQLSTEPLTDLVSAFEQDQTVSRYQTWPELEAYCRRSANPVGRVVLKLLGEPGDLQQIEGSDRICTALQLTNHWQDVRRDLLERDRIYIPAVEYAEVENFEVRFRESAIQGWGVDPTFLGESREVIRRCVERTWGLYEKGVEMIPELGPRSRPVIDLFVAGGTSVLCRVEQWNHETVLYRPRLGKLTKVALVVKSWLKMRRGA